MTRVSVRQDIAAPAERVFGRIADVERLPERDADVLAVELLGDVREGVGLRFRERRKNGKGELVSELEVTEYAPPERIRFVTENHGTVWDTVFRVTPRGAGCELAVTMEARPSRWLPRILNPLMKPLFASGIRKHVRALAADCERPG
ncbi:MAG: SRPBCC family protein [Myxococcota bacterium]